MRVYARPTKTYDEDMLLASWFMRMQQDGDLDRTFLPSGGTLSGFFQMFNTCELAYEADDSGITIAMWCERFMQAALTGLWIRSDKRHVPSTLKALLRLYDAVLDGDEVKTIIGITKQPKLLAEHERLGYRVLGEVPHLWGDEPAWIVVLTRENFEVATNGWNNRQRQGRAEAVKATGQDRGPDLQGQHADTTTATRPD